MGAPQIILIVLWVIEFVLGAYYHGKPKDGKHNIFTTVIGTGIMAGLTLWGGFFK